MRLFFFIAVLIVLSGCKEPEARRPVSVKTGTFFDESVARNKKMLQREEEAIQTIMAKDTLHTYYASPNGFWYYYEEKEPANAYTPQKDDLVFIHYNLRTLHNSTLYTTDEIGNRNVKIDSEIIFPGLNAGVKLMKKGETVTFLFPSSLAYGYPGDGDKIGINVPLMSTVTLIDIIKNP